MARLDHAESAIGVVRATLNADIDPAKVDTVVGVGLNASGRILVGAPGQTGIVGVIIPNRYLLKAGQQADIFKHGDIVDIEGLAAGTKYFIDPTNGSLSATATAGRVYAGYTVEADRLVLSGFAGVVAV